ncbi:MAG: hypothetical protein R3B69_02185 [Candidatus Paceibacterota bacterium]
MDSRVKKALKAEEVSVGDYVLTGGELPALSIVDSVARQLPGVLGTMSHSRKSGCLVVKCIRDQKLSSIRRKNTPCPKCSAQATIKISKKNEPACSSLFLGNEV